MLEPLIRHKAKVAIHYRESGDQGVLVGVISAHDEKSASLRLGNLVLPIGWISEIELLEDGAAKNGTSPKADLHCFALHGCDHK